MYARVNRCFIPKYIDKVTHNFSILIHSLPYQPINIVEILFPRVLLLLWQIFFLFPFWKHCLSNPDVLLRVHWNNLSLWCVSLRRKVVRNVCVQMCGNVILNVFFYCFCFYIVVVAIATLYCYCSIHMFFFCCNQVWFCFFFVIVVCNLHSIIICWLSLDICKIYK